MYRVIVVEDEQIIRKGIIFTTPWAELDCTVVGEAGNGQQGAALIESLRPDIVLCDVTMPLMDGLAMLRQTSGLGFVAIILSGYADFDYARQAIEQEVCAYLLKPVEPQELVRAIEKAKQQIKVAQLYRQSTMQCQTLLEQNPLAALPHQTEDKLAQRMLDYVHRQYQSRITIAEVAEQLHYSEALLMRRFKEAVGTTFNDYLNRYRLSRALTMLREQVPIGEIGDRCGIGAYKYFNYVFKKYMGCSAKTYLAHWQDTVQAAPKEEQ